MSLARLVRFPLLAAIVIAAATAVAEPPDATDGGPEARPRPGRQEGGPGQGPRGEGRPGGGPRGEGRPGGGQRGPGGPGGPGGGPSPERFTEHAFSFDADGDGKLDRAEFESFAKDFHERRRGGPGGGGPGGPGRPGGDRPQRPPRPE